MDWTAVVRDASGPVEGRVVVVPHAGAGPNALVSLIELLPQRYEVVGVTLPGRERRFDEPFTSTPSDPQAVAATVLAELAAMAPLPTVLFGHSMGAAMAGAMATARPEMFVRVVLSAYPPLGTRAELAGRRSEDDLVSILHRGEGTPDEVLNSRFWRKHVIDRLRSDLTLGVRFSSISMAAMLEQPLPVPLTVLSADRDEIVPDYGLAGWQPRAGAGLRMREFPGTHFYLLEPGNREDVAAELAASFSDVAETVSTTAEGQRARAQANWPGVRPSPAGPR